MTSNLESRRMDTPMQIPEALQPTPDQIQAQPQIPVQEPVEQNIPTAQVYDISGTEPVLGDLPYHQVQDAISSGKFAFPKGDVHVVNPEGEFGTLPAEQTPDAFKSGYRYATPEMLKAKEREEKFSTPKQQAITDNIKKAELSKNVLTQTIDESGNLINITNMNTQETALTGSGEPITNQAIEKLLFEGDVILPPKRGGPK